MKQEWNTDKVYQNIKDKIQDKTIQVNMFCGDFDTNSISVEDERTGGRCNVTGWQLESVVLDKDNAGVDIINVAYDRYGTVNASKDDLRVIADVVDAMEKSGFSVTTQGWKDFF